jgi:serine/threonine-protein kinase
VSDHRERDPAPPGGWPPPGHRQPYAPQTAGWDTPHPRQPGPPPGGPPVAAQSPFWPPSPGQNPYPPAGYPSGGPISPPYPPAAFGLPWQQPLPARRAKKWIWFTATAAVVFGGVVGLVVWLVAPPPARPSVAITELDDGVRIGYPTAPVTIDIFDEPICPPCSRFVTSSSADLQRAVNAGKIVLRYHLLNFLDGRSASGDYSTRAVAASFCIAETKNSTTYPNFYVDLFASNFQPAEHASTDRSDAELAHLAQSVGAPTSVGDCITSHRLFETAKTKAANAQTTLENLNSGVDTPTVFNGTTKVDETSPGWVDDLMKSS